MAFSVYVPSPTDPFVPTPIPTVETASTAELASRLGRYWGFAGGWPLPPGADPEFDADSDDQPDDYEDAR